MAAPINTEERKRQFNCEYFTRYGPYFDSPRNLIIVTKLVFGDIPKPSSVLELGCGRGYIVGRLRKHKIDAVGMEVSDHCYLTRVTDSIIQWDIAQTPWPFKDKQFDLCISDGVLETLRPEDLPSVAAEIKRVSQGGIHTIDCDKGVAALSECRGIDQPLEWWQSQIGQSIYPISIYKDGQYRVDFNSGVGKINVGSGIHMAHHGWFNTDIEDLNDFARASLFRFVRLDARHAFPADENSITAIVVSHLLQDLTYQDIQQFMAECWRIMVPGGIIRVSVVDALKIADMYKAGELGRLNDLNLDIANVPTQAGKMSALTCVQSKHDFDSILHMMKEAGFTRIQRMPFGVSNSTHINKEIFDTLPDLSVYIEASKLTF